MKNLFLIIFTFFAFNLSAQEFAMVRAVHDGDSYKIKPLDKDTAFWIRLYGCDAPEVISNHVTKHQPYGIQAGKVMRDLLKGDTVQIFYKYQDQYNRAVCQVFKDSTDLTLHSVEIGNAWWLNDKTMSPKYLEMLKSAQSNAKDSQIGLWGLPGYKNRPSTWRAKYKRVSSKKLFVDLW